LLLEQFCTECPIPFAAMNILLANSVESGLVTVLRRHTHLVFFFFVESYAQWLVRWLYCAYPDADIMYRAVNQALAQIISYAAR
jgi:hypothetical protein